MENELVTCRRISDSEKRKALEKYKKAIKLVKDLKNLKMHRIRARIAKKGKISYG